MQTGPLGMETGCKMLSMVREIQWSLRSLGEDIVDLVEDLDSVSELLKRLQ